MAPSDFYGTELSSATDIHLLAERLEQYPLLSVAVELLVGLLECLQQLVLIIFLQLSAKEELLQLFIKGKSSAFSLWFENLFASEAEEPERHRPAGKNFGIDVFYSGVALDERSDPMRNGDDDPAEIDSG